MKKDEIKCPICNSKEISYTLTSQHAHGKTMFNDIEEFKYFRCDNCKCYFLHGIEITNAYYDRYYGALEQNAKSGILGKVERIFTWSSLHSKKKILDSVTEKQNKKIKLLDVGCGDGTFLEALNTSKYISEGIELGKKDYLTCKRKHLKVYNEDIFKIKLSEKYDVITMWHVLEHIEDPQILFKKLSSLLKDRGILIIATPNIESLGFNLSKENWFHLDAPRHLILYTKVGIKTLSNINSFILEKVTCQRFEFPLDLFWSIRKYPLKLLVYLFYPFFKYIDRETLTYVLRKRN